MSGISLVNTWPWVKCWPKARPRECMYFQLPPRVHVVDGVRSVTGRQITRGYDWEFCEKPNGRLALMQVAEFGSEKMQVYYRASF